MITIGREKERKERKCLFPREFDWDHDGFMEKRLSCRGYDILIIHKWIIGRGEEIEWGKREEVRIEKREYDVKDIDMSDDT